MSLLRGGVPVDPNAEEVWRRRILTSAQRFRPHVDQLNALFGVTRNPESLARLQAVGRVPPPRDSWWSFQRYRVGPTHFEFRFQIRSDTEFPLTVSVRGTLEPVFRIQFSIEAPPDEHFRRHLRQLYVQTHGGTPYTGPYEALNHFVTSLYAETPTELLHEALQTHPLSFAFARTRKIEAIWRYFQVQLAQLRAEAAQERLPSLPPQELDFTAVDIANPDYPVAVPSPVPSRYRAQ